MSASGIQQLLDHIEISYSSVYILIIFKGKLYVDKSTSGVVKMNFISIVVLTGFHCRWKIPYVLSFYSNCLD